MFRTKKDFKQNEVWTYISENLKESDWEDLKNYVIQKLNDLNIEFELNFENKNWISKIFDSKKLSEFCKIEEFENGENMFSFSDDISNLYSIVNKNKSNVNLNKKVKLCNSRELQRGIKINL